MREWIRSHLTYANVISTLCLFLLSGGGTAVALNGSNTVQSDDLGPGAQVKAPDVADNAVNSADVVNESLTGADIKNGRVATADLARPEPWHSVGPGSSTQDLCTNPSVTAQFCSEERSPLIFPWHNYGGGYATAAFYKDQLGIVHLRGLVAKNLHVFSDTPKTSRIFRLPPAYRPVSQRVFSSVGSDGDLEVGPSRVDVQSDGLVVFVQDCANLNDTTCSGNGPYVTLDGISFRPDE